MIKVGDLVKHKTADICGTVMRIEPICKGSNTLIAEIRMAVRGRELANVKNLVVIPKSDMRWRAK